MLMARVPNRLSISTTPRMGKAIHKPSNQSFLRSAAMATTPAINSTKVRRTLIHPNGSSGTEIKRAVLVTNSVRTMFAGRLPLTQAIIYGDVFFCARLINTHGRKARPTAA